MINKLKKYFKNKKAVGSISTAIKVVTACVLGATVLVGGVALTNDVVLPNTETKVASVAAYQGDGVGGGSVGGVTPVSVPAAYDPSDPSLHYTNGIEYERHDELMYGDYIYEYDGHSFEVSRNNSIADSSRTSYGPILESINGIPVCSLSAIFEGCTNMVTAPVIPSGVTYVSGRDFCDCSSLTEIHIPCTATMGSEYMGDCSATIVRYHYESCGH